MLLPGVRQSRTRPIATTRTRLAEKPAWLMIPFALASRSAGFDVRREVEADHRRRSADPDDLVSTTSSQNGASPGQTSTTVHTATIDQTMVSTWSSGATGAGR